MQLMADHLKGRENEDSVRSIEQSIERAYGFHRGEPSLTQLSRRRHAYLSAR